MKVHLSGWIEYAIHAWSTCNPHSTLKQHWTYIGGEYTVYPNSLQMLSSASLFLFPTRSFLERVCKNAAPPSTIVAQGALPRYRRRCSSCKGSTSGPEPQAAHLFRSCWSCCPVSAAAPALQGICWNMCVLSCARPWTAGMVVNVLFELKLSHQSLCSPVGSAASTYWLMQGLAQLQKLELLAWVSAAVPGPGICWGASDLVPTQHVRPQLRETPDCRNCGQPVWAQA